MNYSRINCLKWRLDPSEYILVTNETLIALYQGFNQTHFNGSYEIKKDSSAYVCIPSDSVPPVYFMDLIYAAEWILSIISILLSISIHFLLPVKLKTDSRPLLLHLLCLCYFYIASTIFTLTINVEVILFGILRYTITYSKRAAICWLTVINFELWRHLRLECALEISVGRWEFLMKSVFAWTMPGVIVGITYAIGLLEEQNIGKQELEQNRTQVIVLYMCTEVILLVNIVFFILTIWNLHQYGKTIVLANNKIHKQLGLLYVKLMIATGVCWIFAELESSLLGVTPSTVWVFADVITSLQGFFLFIVYHCKNSTFKKIKKVMVRKSWLLASLIPLSN